MKSLKISAEQEEKLLEMCKALFPELLIDEDSYFDDDGIINTNYKISDGEYDGFRMHWFEFCNTWLVEKILNPNPDKPTRNISDNFKNYFWETNLYWDKNRSSVENNDDSQNDKKHPIDYLYVEFLKLKP